MRIFKPAKEPSQGIVFDAYGTIVELCTSNPALMTALRRVVPPGASMRAGATPEIAYALASDGDRHVLMDGTRRIARSASTDVLLDYLESELHFRVAVAARTRLFVHAGVVGWNGEAIAVPGRSHAGKSSLVAALVRAGATYYSDEYAVLDDDGFVHPFARALGLRDGGGRTRRVDPCTVGAVGVAPLPVTRVIVTRHVAGGAWRVAPMSPGETVLALLDNTLAARTRSADALRILATVARRASGFRGERGDAVEAVKHILRTELSDVSNAR